MKVKAFSAVPKHLIFRLAKLLLLILCARAFQHLQAANPAKKTYLLIRKGELTEARKQIEQIRLKGKDDFGIDYVFSHYFLSPYQKTLQLDSAYLYCLKAIDKFRKETPSGKKRYERLDLDYFRIDSAELFSRKEYLDSLGFSKAQNLESEFAYQWFLDHFPQSSRQNQAKARRASLAFARAREENSYQAFEKFLEKYPDAGEAAEANEIRELMLFQNAVKNGKLTDWEEFIKKYPNNRYVVKAQEKIYQLSTRKHQAASYFDFIRKYPGNPNVSRAWDWIFYLEGAEQSPAALARKYPGFPETSFEAQFRLRNTQLIPYTERKKFGWMDEKGHCIIHPKFDSIPEEARCEVSGFRFLKSYLKGKVSVFCMDSFPVTAGEFDDAEWFQNGIIKVFKGKKQGLYHIAGYPLIEPHFEQIHSISPGLLAIEQGTKKFLFTIKGDQIELDGVDEFLPAGPFLVLRSGKKYALLSEDVLLNSLENKPLKPDYKYSRAENAGHHCLLLQEGNSVMLVSGGKLIPLNASGNAQLKQVDWGFLIQEPGRNVLMDSLGNFIGGEFGQIRMEEKAALVKKGGLWGIMNRKGELLQPCQYDSLEPFYGANFHTWKGGKRMLLLESGPAIQFSGSKAPELIKKAGEKNPEAAWYISVSDSLGRKAIFSRKGKLLLPFAYQQISLLDASWFSIQADRKFGLADTSGKIFLKPAFSGISAINPDYVCLAKGKSFSVYNPRTRKTLPDNLASVARGFGNSRNLFVIRLQEKAGLMDENGKQVVPCQYDDILYWNPTKCMVKRNGLWYSYVLSTGKEQSKAIQKFRLLSDRDGEQLYEVEAEGKNGIESTLRGEIAATLHDQIIPFDFVGGLCFFMGSRVQQSSVFNLIYIDAHGSPIKTQYLTEEEYEGIFCD
jgi:hypothetical protein